MQKLLELIVKSPETHLTETVTSEQPLKISGEWLKDLKQIKAYIQQNLQEINRKGASFGVG